MFICTKYLCTTCAKSLQTYAEIKHKCCKFEYVSTFHFVLRKHVFIILQSLLYKRVQKMLKIYFAQLL